MLGRGIQIGIVAAWLVLTAWLIRSEVWPAWQTAPPPRDLPQTGTERFQAGLFDDQLRRVGTARVRIRYAGGRRFTTSHVHLNASGPLGESLDVVADYRTDADGKLDSFSVKLKTLGQDLRIEGERVGPQFSAEVIFGPIRRVITFNARTTAQLCHSTQPMIHLANLQVGQRWTVEMMDPLRAGGFRRILVEVVGKETLIHGGKPVEVFRVVGGDEFTAWVRPDGRILQQRVKWPMGTMTLIDEPFQ